ncbi:MAG TPA: ATP-binding protein [Egibacteraceae bacterium]|nr:ATP-binding protein [Egibacteraceae bacterium]
MLRRLVLVIPLVGAASAGIGELTQSLIAGVVAAALLGLVAALWLGRAEERRVTRLAEQIARFPDAEITRAGSRAWRRLAAALDTLGSSLRARADEVTAERGRLERLLDDLPTAVLLFDESTLTYANAAGRALFPVRRDPSPTPLQVLGASALADAVAEARETGAVIDVDVRRDGRELVGSASVTAPSEVALVLADLTDIRRIDAVRRDFVINASHELKTPVAGIQALADSLSIALQRDPERADRMIERLGSEAERLAQMVRELLDLARLEEEDAQRDRLSIDLAEIVGAEVDRLKALAEQRQIMIRTDCRAARVVAVSEDMRLIVANLLENALQYNRPGGRVSVTTWRSGSEVTLEVADTGIGMAEADCERVFERFYRVDKARSRAAGGTGLGLALVRHAVERHGGTVSVASVLGEGSTFRVVLPIEGAPADDA